MAEAMSIWSELIGLKIKQYYADVAGIKTRVLESGKGDALFLIHGTGGHLEAFARNMRELSKYFRVIAYDMIGHGYTDKPDLSYTVDYLSDHLVGLAKSLGVRIFHISGESLGAWVAAWTAAHYPAYVGRVILNTPGNITNKPEVMKMIKDTTIRAVTEATYESVRARLEWLFYDKTLVTNELVQIECDIYKQPELVKAIYHIVSLQNWETRKRFAWNTEWTHKIKAPALILWTDHDPTGTIDEANMLKQWIPNSQLHVINDAGHWPQWENPEEFNRVHVEFLSKR